MTKDFKKLIRNSKYKGFNSLERDIYGKRNSNLHKEMKCKLARLNFVMNKIGYEVVFKEIEAKDKSQ